MALRGSEAAEVAAHDAARTSTAVEALAANAATAPYASGVASADHGSASSDVGTRRAHRAKLFSKRIHFHAQRYSFSDGVQRLLANFSQGSQHFCA